MGDKRVHVSKVPQELLDKLDEIAKEKEIDRSQLIVQTLEEIYYSDIDYLEQRRLSDMIRETQNMIAALLKEFKHNNELNRNIINILMGNISEE